LGANPNPSRITAALWDFWLWFDKYEPHASLSGIFADKPGYHNARANLPKTDYSVVHENDRLGPADKAAAIDITFKDAQAGDFKTIKKYAKRLLKSGKDSHDERGNYLREFFGQADADRGVEGWDFQSVSPSTSDASHLWHLHISIVRRFLNDPKAFRALKSILLGESVETWRTKEKVLAAPPRPKTHKVKPGETLATIARHYGQNARHLYNLNRNVIEKAAKEHGRTSSGNGNYIFPDTVLDL
jgi:LysM repeat protein